MSNENWVLVCLNECDTSELPYSFYYPPACLIFEERLGSPLNVGMYADEKGNLANKWLDGTPVLDAEKWEDDGCLPNCVSCEEESYAGEIMEVITLSEGWRITRVDCFGRDTWIFHHKCIEQEPILGRLQKNTHKRYGVRYRCTRCKAIAPEAVVVHLKLKKIGDVR